MTRTWAAVVRDARRAVRDLPEDLATLDGIERDRVAQEIAAQEKASRLAREAENGRRTELTQELRDGERRLASLERSISEARSEANRLKSEVSQKEAEIREIRSKFGFVQETIRD